MDEENAPTATAMEKENYDYLLGMTMWSLTKEKKDDLLRQRDEKIAELKRLQVRTPISLWKEDLENLLYELNKVDCAIFFLNKIFINFIFLLLYITVGRKRAKRIQQAKRQKTTLEVLQSGRHTSHCSCHRW